MGFNHWFTHFCALSTLRRSGLRTASAAAKPCQGDSLEFYLITGSIYTDKRGTVTNQERLKDLQHSFLLLDAAIMIQKSVSMPVRRSQHHMEAILHNKDIKRFTVADDLKESSKNTTSP
ncbi:hypothetical protein Tco_1263665 [Tanacetum coccineum]